MKFRLSTRARVAAVVVAAMGVAGIITLPSAQAQVVCTSGPVQVCTSSQGLEGRVNVQPILQGALRADSRCVEVVGRGQIVQQFAQRICSTTSSSLRAR